MIQMFARGNTIIIVVVFAVILRLTVSYSTSHAINRRQFELYRNSVGIAKLSNRFLGKSTSSLFASDVEVRQVKGLIDGMKIKKIPNSELLVSEISLGTMNFGEQVERSIAMQILNKATKDYGINFLDTAEIFPSPAAESTQGASERIIGDWLRTQAKSFRKEIVISTKVCGFSKDITWCRKGKHGTRLSRQQIVESVDASLKRLQTDYIDILQLHWPERYVPMYGERDYSVEFENNDATSIREQLEIIQDLIKQGKVRSFGLSNETPYGVGAFSATARCLNLPAPSVVQNSYNLLERRDIEPGMIEACSKINGDLGIIAYSPLAGGALTGKYAGDLSRANNNDRLKKYVGFMHRYISPPAQAAVKEYLRLAEELSLPLTPIALAWIYSKPYITSTTIGVSSLGQLEDNVYALNIAPMSSEINDAIDEIYHRNLEPTKGRFKVYDSSLEYNDPSKAPWGSREEDIDPELDALIGKRIKEPTI